MYASLRPYVTAGVALVGAGVIAVTPIAPSAQPDTRAASADVRLAAASIFNIPANLIISLLSMPSASIADMQRFSAAMVASGSWNETSPGNVWGWDPENPEMLKGFIGMLMPFAALSHPLGEHLNWWAAANLPMHPGCAFECSDPVGMLNSMFRVPMWEFWDANGYTFGEVINPVDGKPTKWSGATVKLESWEPVTSVIRYLLADPVAPVLPTMYEIITALAKLASALQTTEHLPKWIAVREIETFLKLFFPAPAEADEERQTPAAELIALPSAARTVTLDASVLSASVDDPWATTVADATGADVSGDDSGAQIAGSVDSGSSVDPAGVPATLVDDEVTPTGPAGTPAATDASEDSEPEQGTGSFDLSDTEASLQEKFDTADQEETEDTEEAEEAAEDTAAQDVKAPAAPE